MRPFIEHFVGLRRSQAKPVTLREITLSGIRECHIPMARAILGHLATQVDALTLVVMPRHTESFPWKMLDIILFALYINNHMSDNSKLTLSPASLGLNTVIAKFNGSQNAALESLFPLSTLVKR